MLRWDQITEDLVAYYQDFVPFADLYDFLCLSLRPDSARRVLRVAEDQHLARLCLFLKIRKIDVPSNLISDPLVVKPTFKHLPLQILRKSVVVVVDRRHEQDAIILFRVFFNKQVQDVQQRRRLHDLLFCYTYILVFDVPFRIPIDNSLIKLLRRILGRKAMNILKPLYNLFLERHIKRHIHIRQRQNIPLLMRIQASPFLRIPLPRKLHYY